MPSHKLNIPRITDLITQYAEINGVDSNFETLTDIVTNIKLNKTITFKETVLLASILNVSPDYITGLSNEKEYDDELLKILSAFVSLNSDMKKSLLSAAEHYKEIQENVLDFDAAGVNVVVHNKNGRVISESLPKANSSHLMAADESKEYISK